MTAEAQKLTLIQMILSLQDYQVLDKIEQLLKTNGAKTNGSAMPEVEPPLKKRKYGFAKGMTLYIAPDFDETPPGFEEYMQDPE
ncbi:MAG: hypothetical protein Q7T20_02305 [Saprospiraceae bacterium]|nr:hypothetical protein [Saprospiraceae bacterium]